MGLKTAIRRNLPFPIINILQKTGIIKTNTPLLGRINRGDFNRLKPFSKQFGYDRGGPVDRYYIENFLAHNAKLIKGRVLEIGDNEYTLRYGGEQVTQSDILHIDNNNPKATFVGDLSNAPHLPDNSFDCIVLTQTLHLIYHHMDAIRTCRRILKPGGTLLLTVPGISQIASDEWGDYWLWSFTKASITKILSEVFPPRSFVYKYTWQCSGCRVFFIWGRLTRNEKRRNGLFGSTLSGYYNGPCHQTCNRMILSKLRQIFREKRVAVLMYHRIARPDIDPWQLVVSPEHFNEQLTILKEQFRVISIPELARQITQNKIRSNQVCITFDDGYKDNFQNARPLLEKHALPATFFICTNYISLQQPFWWDELEGVTLRAKQLPGLFALNINGHPFSFDLRGEEQLTTDLEQKHNGWVWPQPAPTKRSQLYLSLWEKIRQLPHDKIQLAIEAIKEKLSITAQVVASEYYPMTMQDLRQLATNHLFYIGLHTHTHTALTFHNREVQQKEIVKNKKQLEEICAYPVDTISYPHGLYNDDTTSIFHELGLLAGFTTKGKLVKKDTPRYRLGRFQVNNWNGEVFRKKLYDWFKH